MKTRIIKTLANLKTATLAVLGILAVLVFAAAPAQSKQDKVEVCHNGMILSVAGPALAAHLAHGDLPVGSEGCIELPDPF